ncbi:hypothetical protein [Komagataeibacter sp. FNDCF1]|uniref:hypothetical protein n=1 Tax=Komagataeibacter sp. FNDCF1 TaxID=2878681 RepID=UPI001E326C3E|nr:hypothetical protein [Komagataeibacter sp. FNDCF1]MCE2564514.1 hypothetical protein [Komagataeibacter sp. FNDCF1]
MPPRIARRSFFNINYVIIICILPITVSKNGSCADNYDIEIIPSGNIPAHDIAGAPAHLIHADEQPDANTPEDGRVVESARNGVSLYRYTQNNMRLTSNLFSQFENRYNGPLHPDQNNVWFYSTTGVDTAFNPVRGYQGNTSTLRLDLNGFSQAAAGSFDIALQSNAYRHGTAWTWGNLSVIEELTNEMLRAHDTQEWVGEWDLSGFGNDSPASAHNPMAALRHGFVFSTWNSGGGYGTQWQAAHTYRQGDAVEAGIDGTLYSFIAVRGGVSGGMPPPFAVTADPAQITSPDTGHAIPDGTLAWAFNGRMLMQVGCMICISYQPDMLHAPDRGMPADPRTGKRIPVAFGTLLTGDAPVYNAALDFSVLPYLDGVHVFTRTQRDSYLDFSADGTTGGRNNHLLGYDSALHTLTYRVRGATVLSIRDDGTLVSAAPARMPVMTRARIRTLPAPQPGMEIYDSDDDAPALYTHGGWKLIPLAPMPHG